MNKTKGDGEKAPCYSRTAQTLYKKGLVISYLGKLRLGETRLAHLRGLAHGDVALCQRPLGEGLGGPILASLAVWSIALTDKLVS